MGNIGKRIQKRRKELGITQQELAEKLGYKSKSSIAKIEAGTNDIPQNKVSEFASALNTTPAYLMGIEESKLSDVAADINYKYNTNFSVEYIAEKISQDPILLDIFKLAEISSTESRLAAYYLLSTLNKEKPEK